MADASDAEPIPSSRGPIHVLHVVTSLEPGGLENGVVNLSNGLDPARFRTTIVCLERIGAFASRLRAEVTVLCLDKPPGFHFPTVWRFTRLLARVPPGVVHTHNLGPLIYAVLARLIGPVAWGVPILHGEHGALQGEDLRPKRLRQRRLLFRSCRKIHTVSGALRDHLTGHGFPRERMVALLNGVDCHRFCPPEDRAAAKVAAGLPGDAPVIGLVGRFIPSKRHLLLIEAFERLRESGTGTNLRPWLLFLGDGGTERDRVLARIQASPARDCIRSAGHQADPAPWYRAMDLVAMPSSSEGLSNALLEAMATGVPCLAHPACGASEVITDGKDGLLRPMETAEDLAAALEGILADPAGAERLGKAARATALERFSLESMVDGYARLYEDVAGSL